MTGQPLHSGQQPPQVPGGPGHQGYAQYPPPAGNAPGKAKHGGVTLVVAFVGIVALFSAGGLGLHFLLKGAVEPNPEPHPVANPQATSPTTGPVTSPTRRQSPPRTTKPSELPDVEATISGWQPVADPKTSVAYDVPEEWKVESPTTLVGFEDENGPRTAMHAVGTYKDEACSGVSGSYRGHTGIMGELIEDGQPRKVAEVGANLWASAAAEVPEDDPSAPEPEAKEISLDAGMRAWQATVTIGPPDDGDCAAPELRVTTVSFTPRDDGGAVLFVMYTDQGVDDALPSDTENKIISTLRPVG